MKPACYDRARVASFEKTMKKKPSEAKNSKPQPSMDIVRLKAQLVAGDYYGVRKQAHTIMNASDKSPAEKDAARQALKITWPDSIALLTGFLCLSFTVGVTFLVAY